MYKMIQDVYTLKNERRTQINEVWKMIFRFKGVFFFASMFIFRGVCRGLILGL